MSPPTPLSSLASVKGGPARVVFELRGPHRPQQGAGPLAQVCGLPVLVRNLLLLQRVGFKQVILINHPEDRPAIEKELSRHRQINLSVSRVEDEGEALAPLITALTASSDPASDVLYWPGTLSFGRFAPQAVQSIAPPGGALVVTEGSMGNPLGLALFNSQALSAHPDLTADQLVEMLEQHGKAETVSANLGHVFIRSPREVQQAEKALLFSLRKTADGAVAKFDRYVSLAISRQLMRLPIKPNHVTFVAGLLGIACGFIAAQGGYFWMLLGALGFQLNSILDGIDGEIARAKLFESKIGAWLDTLADDSSNLAFTLGVSIGCYRTWGSDLYLVLGAISSLGFLLTAILMYHYLITVVHSGDLNDFKMPWDEGGPGPGKSQEKTLHPLSRILMRLKFIIRRDAFVFLTTCFALAGQLRIMAWLYAMGASTVWITIVVYRVLMPYLQRSKEQLEAP